MYRRPLERGGDRINDEADFVDLAKDLPFIEGCARTRDAETELLASANTHERRGWQAADRPLSLTLLPIQVVKSSVEPGHSFTCHD